MQPPVSKAALKAAYTKQELKLMKREQKQRERESLYIQAEQLLGPRGAEGRVSRKAAEEAIREHNTQRQRRLVRISSAITAATVLLGAWWLVIAATTPSHKELAVLAVLVTPPLVLACVVVVGASMKYKTLRQDGRAYIYRDYLVIQFPPLRLFVSVLMLHLWYRTGVLMDGGALEQRSAADGAGGGDPSGLALALGVVIPASFALAFVLPALVLLPTYAANERLGGFNEVKQFYLYLGVSAIYAAIVGTSALWRAAALLRHGNQPSAG